MWFGRWAVALGGRLLSVAWSLMVWVSSTLGDGCENVTSEAGAAVTLGVDSRMVLSTIPSMLEGDFDGAVANSEAEGAVISRVFVCTYPAVLSRVATLEDKDKGVISDAEVGDGELGVYWLFVCAS